MKKNKYLVVLLIYLEMITVQVRLFKIVLIFVILVNMGIQLLSCAQIATINVVRAMAEVIQNVTLAMITFFYGALIVFLALVL
jgi:hypothetical protein